LSLSKPWIALFLSSKAQKDTYGQGILMVQKPTGIGRSIVLGANWHLGFSKNLVYKFVHLCCSLEFFEISEQFEEIGFLNKFSIVGFSSEFTKVECFSDFGVSYSVFGEERWLFLSELISMFSLFPLLLVGPVLSSSDDW